MHSRALKAVIIVEIISAVFGFWGGIPLLIDPSGRILELETNLIASLPIKNFVLPGIWLLVVYGCGCSIAAYGLWNLKRWGWLLAIFISLTWIAWVSFELYMWSSLSIAIINTTWPWLIPPIIALILLFRHEVRMLVNE
ncbi:MAG: DUF2127 domain-containing protein [Nitrososphaeraceae archaeon]